MTVYLSVDWVLAYHQELMAAMGQSSSLLGREAHGKLESALFRPAAEAFGTEFYPALAEKAAVLLQGLLIAHPFTDGNKRAAVGSLLSFLELNGASIDADEDALYDFVIAVTTGELREVEEIAARVRALFRLD